MKSKNYNIGFNMWFRWSDDTPEPAKVKYHTGVWSPTKIQYIPENCTQCGMCFSACPDSAIIHDENGKMIGVDTDHCKACGLCVEACNFNALEIQRKNK